MKTSPSPRQVEFLCHLACGASNGEIAKAMGLSEKTVEARRAQVRARMGIRAHSPVALVLTAVHRGFIPMPRLMDDDHLEIPLSQAAAAVRKARVQSGRPVKIHPRRGCHRPLDPRYLKVKV